MSASQLLMQRYMIANPPRAFGKPARKYATDLPEDFDEDALEIIPCPDCDGATNPRFDEAMREFHRSAVLIPSEET